MHLIGSKPTSESQEIIVSEGYATGSSIHQAGAGTVYITFDSGNINAAIETIRSKYPNNPIIVMGDDDHHLKHNAGKEKAIEATKNHSNTSATFPQFKDRGNQTDFNDLHQSEGIEQVKSQLQFAISAHHKINTENTTTTIQGETAMTDTQLGIAKNFKQFEIVEPSSNTLYQFSTSKAATNKAKELGINTVVALSHTGEFETYQANGRHWKNEAGRTLLRLQNAIDKQSLASIKESSSQLPDAQNKSELAKLDAEKFTHIQNEAHRATAASYLKQNAIQSSDYGDSLKRIYPINHIKKLVQLCRLMMEKFT